MAVRNLCDPDGAGELPSAHSPIVSVSRRDAAVSIGPILPLDFGPLYLWLNDVEAAKDDYPAIPVDPVAYKDWLDHGLQSAAQHLFIIRKLAPEEAIGFVTLRNINAVHRSAELGARIGHEKDRGQGFGTRAVMLAVDYAFRTLNLQRVSLSVRADNARAIASYRRAGFDVEGVLRRACYLEGMYVDMVAMAILRPEGGQG